MAALVLVTIFGVMWGTNSRTAGAATRCRTMRVPVQVPGYSGDAHITGDYCTPGHSNGTTLLLVAGGGEDADYWDMAGLPAESLVDAANQAGYTTLAVDRLGTGRSTRPPSSRTITYDAQVATIGQVADALHQHGKRLIAVGHSLGSVALTGVAAAHPHEFSAMVLTGTGPVNTPLTAELQALYHVPARGVAAKWAKLDTGYVTTAPANVDKGGSLYPPGMNARELREVASHQDILSMTEIHTRPRGDAVKSQDKAIRGPVLVMNGQEDSHYCLSSRVGAKAKVGPQCATQRAFRDYERPMLPNADLSTYVIPHTGHATEWHTSAHASNQRILDWLGKLPAPSAR